MACKIYSRKLAAHLTAFDPEGLGSSRWSKDPRIAVVFDNPVVAGEAIDTIWDEDTSAMWVESIRTNTAREKQRI